MLALASWWLDGAVAALRAVHLEMDPSPIGCLRRVCEVRLGAGVAPTPVR